MGCSPSSKRSQRCRRLVAAATDYGEAYENLFRSKVGVLVQILGLCGLN
jgi:hypothetical protein